MNLPDCLLVLSLLFVRPVPDGAWPRRLVLHALLLLACLVATELAPAPGAPPGVALRSFGLAASLVQLAIQLVLMRGRSAAGPAAFVQNRMDGAGWLLAGLALVALAIRLLHDASPRGLLAVCTASLLAGLLGAVAARTPFGRIGSLLLAGDPLILGACRLPGMDWFSLGAILLLQAGLLAGSVRARAADAAGQEAPS